MPDSAPNGSEGDRGKEVSGKLVVAGGDPPEMLELVEEALDEIALAVEFWIDGAHDPYIALRGDVGCGAAGGEELDDGAGTVAAVGNGLAGGPQAFDQCREGGLVGGLTGREHQANGKAVAIDHGVDFCAQSSARAADGMIRAPFFPPAAC